MSSQRKYSLQRTGSLRVRLQKTAFVNLYLEGEVELLCVLVVGVVNVFLTVGGDDTALKQTLDRFNPYSHVHSTSLLVFLQFVAI